jgi:Esterase-like activity of phytase
VRHPFVLSLLIASALPQASNASVILLAQGSLGGDTDLSGLTGLMENGLPGNILGGVGSGLAYAGGNSFLALPDRGPNATPYNAAVDNTVSYISRFQTLSMILTPNAPGSELAFSLTSTLTGTTLLFSPTALTYGTGAGLGLGSGVPALNSADQFYFSGRSDNFGAGNSGDPANARFDPEAIRVSNDGKSVFISDEYGPYVRQFDRITGKLIRTYTLPANLTSPNLSPVGNDEISGNTTGRTANKGMEGLAITPDGKTLVGIMQAPLIQDAAVSATKKLVRIVTIDIATGATKEYGYKLTTGSGVSEIIAINDHQFIIDERDGKGLGDNSDAAVKQLFTFDITGATDITNLSGAAAVAGLGTKSATPFIDLVAALTALGIPKSQIPSKIEGLALGQDVTFNGALYHTLYVSNDNDFLPGEAGGNNFYVFGFQDADLPGFIAQQISAVPESSTWAMMVAGFGLMGAAIRRKQRVRVQYS